MMGKPCFFQRLFTAAEHITYCETGIHYRIKVSKVDNYVRRVGIKQRKLVTSPASSCSWRKKSLAGIQTAVIKPVQETRHVVLLRGDYELLFTQVLVLFYFHFLQEQIRKELSSIGSRQAVMSPKMCLGSTEREQNIHCLGKKGIQLACGSEPLLW